MNTRHDYDEYVAGGFCIMLDAIGTVLSWICKAIFIVFGWPFAALCWLTCWWNTRRDQQ